MVTQVASVTQTLPVANNIISAISNSFWQQWQQVTKDFIHIQLPSKYQLPMVRERLRGRAHSQAPFLSFFFEKSAEIAEL